MTKLLIRIPAFAIALAIIYPLSWAAWPADHVRIGDLVIEQPWARASIGTSRPSAAYLTVENQGGTLDRLTHISSADAGMAEVHAVTEENGVMRMHPAGPLEIPPGGRLELKPGGMHVMLMQLRAPLVEGGTLNLELTFERAGRVMVQVPVLGLSAMGPE